MKLTARKPERLKRMERVKTDELFSMNERQLATYLDNISKEDLNKVLISIITAVSALSER